jgi:hypothetical protein
MKLKRRSSPARVLASLGLALAIGMSQAHAASLEGRAFDDSIRLSQHTLQLNGLGVRAVFVFKAYVAALYLEEKATSLQQITDKTGPKRLQLHMLLPATAANFNDALVAGIRKNAGPADLTRLNDRVEQLATTIKQVGASAAGDVINFDYLPDVGTTVTLNGLPKGTPITGADFYQAILGIFVGDNPVDPNLKKGLLGL